MTANALRIALGAIAATVLVLVVVSYADGAGTQRVALGDYESAPSIPPDAGYTVGVFTVERSKGRRQIVRSEKFAGIYYPDAGECDDFDLPLGVESIPVSPTGTFRHSERTPVEDTTVKVTWRGAWSSRSVVAGSVKIRYDGCVSKNRWTGGKVG